MASMHISLIVLSSLIALGASNSQASLSLLQTSITLQRGSVNEIAPSTGAASVANTELAKKSGSAAARVPAQVPAQAKSEEPCQHCPELNFEGEEDDELAAHASKVSLMQTSFSLQRAPGRMDELASLAQMGIEDDDEALGLLDAAMDYDSFGAH
mmetsp:Transcript_56465/g.127643  ORF Transcript_56465/g.127643 Transcript_56465/m.127643 type:complete len:155 (+) Transcript_56465:95-559(+)